MPEVTMAVMTLHNNNNDGDGKKTSAAPAPGPGGRPRPAGPPSNDGRTGKGGWLEMARGQLRQADDWERRGEHKLARDGRKAAVGMVLRGGQEAADRVFDAGGTAAEAMRAAALVVTKTISELFRGQGEV